MSKNEYFPNNLKSLRKSLGLTLEEFGRPVNLSKGQVQKYETGENSKLHVIRRIKEKYGFTWDQIFETTASREIKDIGESAKDEEIKILKQSIKSLAIKTAQSMQEKKSPRKNDKSTP